MINDSALPILFVDGPFYPHRSGKIPDILSDQIGELVLAADYYRVSRVQNQRAVGSGCRTQFGMFVRSDSQQRDRKWRLWKGSSESSAQIIVLVDELVLASHRYRSGFR